MEASKESNVDTSNVARPQAENTFIKAVSSKCISIIANEMAKTETQMLIKQSIIQPLINILYVELYPYIITLIVIIILILILSLLTFLTFILYYFKNT